jgi:hypothetical protein
MGVPAFCGNGLFQVSRASRAASKHAYACCVSRTRSDWLAAPCCGRLARVFGCHRFSVLFARCLNSPGVSVDRSASPEPRYHLVLRSEGSPAFSLILNGTRPVEVLKRALKKVKGKRPRRAPAKPRKRSDKAAVWAARNSFLKQNYRRLGPAECARQLSLREGAEVTRESVLGRAHRLGICKKRCEQ